MKRNQGVADSGLEPPVSVSPLSADDLVPDHPLGIGQVQISPGEDLLHHRGIARRIAELAITTAGNTNIALFGPWGSGKSSFNALLREELRSIDKDVVHLTFDSWKNSGEGFQANFLSELSAQLTGDARKMRDELFETTSSVQMPVIGSFTSKRGVSMAALMLAVIFIVIPSAWTFFLRIFSSGQELWEQIGQNIAGWAGAATGSTLLFAIVATLSKLSQVTVQRSSPSSVAQFGVLFNRTLEAKQNRRYVIFVDELDRCSPEDVMRTLEGLRTFLGHKDCVFVVAFDREAIAATVAKKATHGRPEQPTSPYYVTSGEYLDKIFQFQVSLPPQPRHTFRRYAYSLVEHRAGIWRTLREAGTERLDRVVSVLSPMHLTSPRRTKVLLNDFAVNARIYEGLEFDWVARAEEIAVLTVLQTEFPRFVADLEREPALLQYLQSGREPRRAGLVAVVTEYRDLIDGAEAKNEDTKPGEADPVPPKPLDIVRAGTSSSLVAGLGLNLSRYLKRLADMRVVMPAADLIMMHSNGDLLSFEDPQVYNTLQVAGDSPRADVLEDLSSSSPRDRRAAISYLLEQMETERGTTLTGLAILVGEIADRLDEMPFDTAHRMMVGLSERLGVEDSFGPAALSGYLRAGIVAGQSAGVEILLDTAADEGLACLQVVMQKANGLIDASNWKTTAPAMGDYAVSYARELPTVLAAFLGRIGTAPTAELGEDSKRLLIAELSAPTPEPVEAESATVAAREVAATENVKRAEGHAIRVEEAAVTARRIAEIWPEIAPESPLRNELAHALRRARDPEKKLLDIHDRMLEQTASQGFTREVTQLALQAIVDVPNEALRWINLLDDTESVDRELKSVAVVALVRRATKAPHTARREDASVSAFAVASLSSTLSAMPPEIETLIFDDLDDEWEEFSDTRVEYQERLLQVLVALGGDVGVVRERRVALIAAAARAAAEDAADSSALRAITQALEPADASQLASALGVDLMNSKETSPVLVAVILEAQLRARRAGEPIRPLGYASIEDSGSSSLLVNAWIRTIQNTIDVAKSTVLAKVSVDSWHEFGENASTQVRWEVWGVLQKAKSSAASLRAVSLQGVPSDAYQTLTERIRDANTVAARAQTVNDFLTLPVSPSAQEMVVGIVKAMAGDRKVSEVKLGMQVLRMYSPHFTSAQRGGIKALLTKWMDVGGAHLSGRDRQWLVQNGLITKKSQLWKDWLGQ